MRTPIHHRCFWRRLGLFVGLMGALSGGLGGVSPSEAQTSTSETQPIAPWPVGKWQPIMTGIQYGISGMALIESKEATSTSPARRVFLVVHDNKNVGEGRLSLLTIQAQEAPRYTPLAWPKSGALPVDLEALAAVPGHPDAFLALASDGLVSRLQLNEAHNAVQIASSFQLPTYKTGVRANIEGFSIAQIGPSLVAVWATRGSNAQPATLSFATLDLETNTFGTPGTASLLAPWPTAPTPEELAANPKLDVRAVSDLKLDSSGALFVSASSDAGDDGPFNSAFYLAGGMTLVNGSPQFVPSPTPWLLSRFPGHKVEAFDFVPGPNGGPVFGTDDENRGGFVWIN